MGKGNSLSENDQHVLLAVLRLRDNAYGVTIRSEIENCTGKSLSVGALYSILERLEREGYITTFMSKPTAVRGGRKKKMVQISGEGIKAVRLAREHSEMMWAGLVSPKGVRP